MRRLSTVLMSCLSCIQTNFLVFGNDLRWQGWRIPGLRVRPCYELNIKLLTPSSSCVEHLVLSGCCYLKIVETLAGKEGSGSLGSHHWRLHRVPFSSSASQPTREQPLFYVPACKSCLPMGQNQSSQGLWTETLGQDQPLQAPPCTYSHTSWKWLFRSLLHSAFF